MTFVSAFRLNTGYDYAPYATSYLNTWGKRINELSGLAKEKGYVLLELLTSYVSQHASAIFIVCAVLLSLVLYICLRSLSPYPSLGTLMFYLFGYYFNSMNFIRNFTAAMIITAAFAFLRRELEYNAEKMLSSYRLRSFIRYTALVLLASTFHKSALIMLPFWFILLVPFNLATLPVFLTSGGVIIYYITPMMDFITKYIYPSYAPSTSPHMYNGIPFVDSLCLGLVAVIAFLHRKRFYRSGWGTVLISASFFSFFFEYIGSRHSILGRFTMYFGVIVSIALIPELIGSSIRAIRAPDSTPVEAVDEAPEAAKTLKSTKAAQLKRAALKIELYFTIICLLASALTFFIYALTHNYNGVVPHNWIWNL